MKTIDSLLHFSKLYPLKHKVLLSFCFMVFFLLIFDGIILYTLPLMITQSGISKTMMGLIISSSSLIGAIADLVLGIILPSTQFRRLFLLMFVVAFSYVLILFGGSGIIIYIIAMGLWGIWFDLLNFGTYNLVSTTSTHEEYASNFGVIDMFRALAYLIAPIIAGALILDKIDKSPFIAALFFLFLSAVMYIVVTAVSFKRAKLEPYSGHQKILAYFVWIRVAKKIWPVLTMVIFMGVFDSFFLVLGPIISEQFNNLGLLGSLFIPFYFLPLLFVGWFIGRITRRFGKKRTAFTALFLGSLPLLFFPFTKNIAELLALVFLSSILSSIAWPAIKGTIADYIDESTLVEKELEGVTDFCVNIGFVIGPICAGFLADTVGNYYSFSVLGGMSIIICLFLFKFSHRHIRV